MSDKTRNSIKSDTPEALDNEDEPQADLQTSSSFNSTTSTTANEEEQQQSAANMSSELLSNLILYLKACAILLLVWLIGWFNFSFAWILLFVTLYFIRDQVQHQRLLKLSVKRAIAHDEKAVIKAAVEHLPSWVHFPDRERVEWINKVYLNLEQVLILIINF